MVEDLGVALQCLTSTFSKHREGERGLLYSYIGSWDYKHHSPRSYQVPCHQPCQFLLFVCLSISIYHKALLIGALSSFGDTVLRHVVTAHIFTYYVRSSIIKRSLHFDGNRSLPLVCACEHPLAFCGIRDGTFSECNKLFFEDKSLIYCRVPIRKCFFSFLDASIF